MNCPNCSAHIDENAVFCTYCGARVVFEDTEVQMASPEDFETDVFENGQFENPEQTPWHVPQAPQEVPPKGALLLVFSILSVAFSLLDYSGMNYFRTASIGFGIIAVILSSKALKFKSRLAVITLILGIIGLIMSCCAFLLTCALSFIGL